MKGKLKKKIRTVLAVLLTLSLILNLGVGMVNAKEEGEDILSVDNDSTAAETNVAMVTAFDGNVIGSYEDFQAALDAAMNADGSTVTLLSDILLSDAVSITSGNFNIDFAGKTVNHEKEGDSSGTKNVIGISGGNIVFQDSSGGSGGIKNTGKRGIGIGVNGGEVTFQGGTYQAGGGVLVKGGMLTILDGSFIALSGGSLNYNSPVMNVGGTVVIEGGTFDGRKGLSALYIGDTSVNTVIKNGEFISSEKNGNMIGYKYKENNSSIDFDLSQCQPQLLSKLKIVNDIGRTTNITGIRLPEQYIFVDPNGNMVTKEIWADNYPARTVSVKLKEGIPEYTVSFDANGGSGTMEPVGHILREYTLPENGFDPPEGKEFKAWSVDGVEYAPGTEIIIEKDTIVSAVWYMNIAVVIAEDGTEVGYYKDLQSAVNAAGQHKNSTLRLLTDIEANYINLNGGSYTIDLNGKTIVYDTYAFQVNNVDIVFEDSSEGKGVVKNRNDGSFTEEVVFMVRNTSKLTIKNGTYIGGREAVYVFDSTASATIEDGNFSVIRAGGNVMENIGTLTINQGILDGSKGLYAISNSGYLYLNGGSLINGKTGTLRYLSGTLDLSQNKNPAGIEIFNFNMDYSAIGAIGESPAIRLPDGYFLVDKDNLEVTEIAKNGGHATVAGSISYRIIFDANGGSGQMEQETMKEGEYILPECSFGAPEGKVFKAWEIDGEKYLPGQTYAVTKSTTITAVWESLSYTVKFYADKKDETSENKTVTVPYGDYTLPECEFTIPEGKKFKAWEIDGVEYKAGSSYKITGDREIVAVWEDLSYTVKFFTSAGSGTMESKTVLYGDYILPECEFTAPEGQMFKAWMIQGQEYEPGAVYKIIEDTLVVAIWKTRTYAVSFDAGEGSGAMENAEDISSYYTLPACMFTAPEGMQFKAWKVGEVEYAPGDSVELTDDIKVTAIWEEIPKNSVVSVTPKEGAVRSFTDLQSAFDYAMTEVHSRSIITLLSDVELSESVTVSGNWQNDSCTLNFNGHNIILNSEAQLKLVEYADVVFKNSNTVSGGGGDTSIALGGIKGTSSIFISLLQAKLTVDSGTYEEAEGAGIDSIIECSSDSEVIVNGGTFSSKGNIWSSAISLAGSASVTINNGKFNCKYGFYMQSQSVDANLKINGGTYNVIESTVLYTDGVIDFTTHSDPTGIQIESLTGRDTEGSKIQLPEGYVMLDSNTKEPVDILAGNATVIIGVPPEKPTINVEISWGEMSFTYEEGKWNPETHNYDVEEGWKKEESKDAGQIQVTNHSSMSVKVQYKFEKNTKTEGIDDVTGIFDSEFETFNKETKTSVLAQEGGTENVSFSLNGKPASIIVPNSVLGTITVVIGNVGGDANEQ